MYAFLALFFPSPEKADPLRNVQCPLVIFLFLFITGYKKVKKKKCLVLVASLLITLRNIK